MNWLAIWTIYKFEMMQNNAFLNSEMAFLLFLGCKA